MPSIGKKRTADSTEQPSAKRRCLESGKALPMTSQSFPLSYFMNTGTFINKLDVQFFEILTDDDWQTLASCPKLQQITLNAKQAPSISPGVMRFVESGKTITFLFSSSHPLQDEDRTRLREFMQHAQKESIDLEFESHKGEEIQDIESFCEFESIRVLDFEKYSSLNQSIIDAVSRRRNTLTIKLPNESALIDLTPLEKVQGIVIINPNLLSRKLLKLLLRLTNIENYVQNLQNHEIECIFFEKRYNLTDLRILFSYLERILPNVSLQYAHYIKAFDRYPALITEFPNLVSKIFPPSEFPEVEFSSVLKLYDSCKKGGIVPNLEGLLFLLEMEQNPERTQFLYEDIFTSLQSLPPGERRRNGEERLINIIEAQGRNPIYFGFIRQLFKVVSSRHSESTIVQLLTFTSWFCEPILKLKATNPDFEYICSEDLDRFMAIVSKKIRNNPSIIHYEGFLPRVYETMVYQNLPSCITLYMTTASLLLNAKLSNASPILSQIVNTPDEVPDTYLFMNRYQNREIQKLVCHILAILSLPVLGEEDFKNFYKAVRALFFQKINPFGNVTLNAANLVRMLKNLSQKEEKKVVQEGIEGTFHLVDLFFRHYKKIPNWEMGLTSCVTILQNLEGHIRDWFIENEVFEPEFFFPMYEYISRNFHLQTKCPMLFRALMGKGQQEVLTNPQLRPFFVSLYRSTLELNFSHSLTKKHVELMPELAELSVTHLANGGNYHEANYSILDFNEELSDSLLPQFVKAINHFLTLRETESNLQLPRLRELFNVVYTDFQAMGRIESPHTAKFLVEELMAQGEELEGDEQTHLGQLACELIDQSTPPLLEDNSPTNFIFYTLLLEHLSKRPLRNELFEIGQAVSLSLTLYFLNLNPVEGKVLTEQQSDQFLKLFITLPSLSEEKKKKYEEGIDTYFLPYFANWPVSPHPVVCTKLLSAISTSLFYCSEVPVAWTLSSKMVSAAVSPEVQEICAKIAKVYLRQRLTHQVPVVESIHPENKLFIQDLIEFLLKKPFSMSLLDLKINLCRAVVKSAFYEESKESVIKILSSLPPASKPLLLGTLIQEVEREDIRLELSTILSK